MRGFRGIMVLGMLMSFCCEKASLPRDTFPNRGTVSVLRNGDFLQENIRINGTVIKYNGKQDCNIFIIRERPNDSIERRQEEMNFLGIDLNDQIGDTLCLSDTDIFLPEEDFQCVGNAYHTLIGGDVLGDRYKLQTGEDHYLIITEWNAENFTVSGKFQASYVFAEEKHETEWMEDTVRYTNGKFTTTLELKE
ncbi:hypothetical protein [Membranihabitans maritimus]|uniref:hypothetical protein n=1 Tax=Membranihabitans maritimus TaxID=2904244 RepID=UPI001F2CCCCD|nr:hypothetical protein [Membranihabitans maritimus]